MRLFPNLSRAVKLPRSSRGSSRLLTPLLVGKKDKGSELRKASWRSWRHGDSGHGGGQG